MPKENIIINDIEFKYSEKNQAYGKVINVENKNVLVIIYESYVKENINTALEYATDYIKNLDLNFLKELIITQLYEPKDDWYGIDENGNSIEYTKEEYTKKLTLKTISVTLSSVEYIFDADTLYAGHSISIYKKHNDNKYNVTLEG